MSESKDQACWGLLGPSEIEVSKSFINKGYIITDVHDVAALEDIRKRVVTCLTKRHNLKSSLPDNILDQFHNWCNAEELNQLRLEIIHSLNTGSGISESYFSLARPLLEILVGNELVMQRRVNLSIQLPHDANSLLPVHADVWSGDSPYEVVVWTPLVDCYQTKSMFILAPEKAELLHDCFQDFKGRSSEDIYSEIEADIVWLDVTYGKTLVFNQKLPHGNRVNVEHETRWSLNCRFKAVFSPYSDKKLENISCQ